MKKQIVKITHTYTDNPNGICVEYEMSMSDLKKLIHLWQIKLANQEETMDFTEDEMAEILECFGCKIIENTNEANEVIDLYLLWEYGVQTDNPKVTNDDINNPKYNNEKALTVMNRVIKITNEYYESKKY